MSTDTKQHRIVVAAAEQFLRYGLARTTMNDIARAAGMSRPALYLLFPDGKTQLFEAAVVHLSGERMAAIKAALSELTELDDRLFKVCELWCVRLFEMLSTVPDSVDMDNLGFPVVRRVYVAICQIVASLLREAGVDEERAGDLARNLIFGVRGLSVVAQDDSDMRRMTRLQVDTLCSAISQAGLAPGNQDAFS